MKSSLNFYGSKTVCFFNPGALEGSLDLPMFLGDLQRDAARGDGAHDGTGGTGRSFWAIAAIDIP